MGVSVRTPPTARFDLSLSLRRVSALKSRTPTYCGSNEVRERLGNWCNGNVLE